eukprot:5088132-Heterocapsa_arctica.AAC.1
MAITSPMTRTSPNRTLTGLTECRSECTLGDLRPMCPSSIAAKTLNIISLNPRPLPPPLVRYPPVSYTHLTLPTNREV